MKTIKIFVLVLFILTAKVNAQKTNATFITETSWAGITKSTNIDGLKNIFGEANIKDERICGAECVDSVDVTKIYPDTKKEIIIYWADSLYHKKIGMIVCNNEQSVCQTKNGIKIGSTLAQLLKLNGKKISFGGFGWDYGGGITSFNNGHLAKSNITYLLDITGDAPNALLGERQLNTDMALVKKYLSKIKVVQITLAF